MILLGFMYTFSFSQVFTGSAAEKLVNAANRVRVLNTADIPDFISLKSNFQFDQKNTKEWMSNNLNCSSDFQYVVVSKHADQAGVVHYRTQQLYQGIPVKDANFILHETAGKVSSMNGKILRNITISNDVLLTEVDALVKALEYMNADHYKWQSPLEEQFLKKITGDPNASFYPKGEIVLFPLNSENSSAHVYAYKFDIYADKPLNRQYVYIDAASGAVIFTNNRIHHSDTLGSAITRYSGTRDIVTDLNAEIFRLREVGRGQGIETYNMQTGTNYGAAVDFTDADNLWNNVNPQMDEVASDAHWGAEMTYDYFMQKYGRNSIDGNGFKLMSYVHYDVQYANAFWDGQVMTYGDGDNVWSPLTALDICGHEITHGLDEHEANLIYNGESGALNEGYSDIFGTAIEFFGKPTLANWEMGDDIGESIRSLSNPTSMQLPDTYHGTNWYTGTGDNGGVHTNSVVLGYWFYLASVGGSGTNDNGDVYNVTAMTIDKAAAVAYKTLTDYLVEGSDYADARFYSIESAKQLFGGCTPEVETVTNAFYAVGLGSPYFPGVHCDFEAGTTEFCQLPAQIHFTNNTVNGTNYLWDFGDGTTATVLNPVHSYTSGGTYNVTLYSNDTACGSDTIVKAGFVLINLPAAPVVTSASNCGGAASLTLTAIAADSVKWFTTPTGGTPFYTGTSYTTPVLSQSQHYYVESQNVLPPAYGGKPTNAGGGGNFSGNASHYLQFNCMVPVVLKSVKVYAQGAANRTVELRDASGSVLQTATINIPAGESRITLNFNIPVGTDLELASAVAPNLYRNNAGCTYPYNISNMISITKSSAFTSPTNYYYFFYDWEIQEPSCISERIEVSAFINYAAPVASFSYLSYAGNHVNFTNTSTDGNLFFWDFGDGTNSTLENPIHIYSSPGTYSVSLAVTNSCGNNSTSQSIVSTTTGIVDADKFAGILISPNPVSDNLFVDISFTNPDAAVMKVVDLLGNEVLVRNLNAASHYQGNIDVSGFSPGIYMLNVSNRSNSVYKRFIVR